MTIKLGMILVGALLLYGGWTNRDIRSLIFGDNTVAKGGSAWAPTASGATATGPTPSATGAGSRVAPAPVAATGNSAQVSKNTFAQVPGL